MGVVRGVVKVFVEIEGYEVLIWGAGYCEGVGGDVVRVPRTPEPHTDPGIQTQHTA